MGYVIDREGVGMDEHTVKAVPKWPVPQTVRVATIPWFCKFLQAFH